MLLPEDSLRAHPPLYNPVHDLGQCRYGPQLEQTCLHRGLGRQRHEQLQNPTDIGDDGDTAAAAVGPEAVAVDGLRRTWMLENISLAYQSTYSQGDYKAI